MPTFPLFVIFTRVLFPSVICKTLPFVTLLDGKDTYEVAMSSAMVLSGHPSLSICPLLLSVSIGHSSTRSLILSMSVSFVSVLLYCKACVVSDVLFEKFKFWDGISKLL